MIALSEDYLADNPAVAHAVAIAELQAARWAKEDQAGWEQLAMENLEGMTPEQATANYEQLVTELDDWPVNGSLDREMCDYTLTTSKEVGALKSDFKCDDLVSFEYQDAAVELLGEQ